MSESLGGRVKRLISANVNELIDSLENANADAVMRESIREVDRALDDVRDELGQLIAARHRTSRHLDRIKTKTEEFSAKIAAAVAQGRDDLAEAAISRQIDLEAQVPVLEKSIEDMGQQQTELDGFIAALNGRKHEMEEELKVYLQSRTLAGDDFDDGDPATANTVGVERRVERAEKAFNRVMGGPAGMPGDKAASRETVAKLAELETVMRGQQVAERLAAVKAARKEPVDA